MKTSGSHMTSGGEAQRCLMQVYFWQQNKIHMITYNKPGYDAETCHVWTGSFNWPSVIIRAKILKYDKRASVLVLLRDRAQTGKNLLSYL